MGFGKYWTQFYPPKPKFTDKDVGSLAGKVCCQDLRPNEFDRPFGLP